VKSILEKLEDIVAIVGLYEKVWDLEAFPMNQLYPICNN
jgi:hypothetical protein